ncbi:hypothetical protein SARC_11437 [Sphaeroforma arctica JP610]|uniref:Uncharacterized protein n=1 Tax=Sphaeroforma arctica JP610 TaxID=667725 RepID=A0A0L0FHV5_9EUKA|nr:hypothetical protein SARC_11437 [Sphaeroforma arctica JP610]KNC76051.1 hypothetical protein SARC_11437 [Sphaeroforma arctica JP610]|eukprot:XP_014149953.1 hypothetical protein SARC_11437 [Sphaeroforma arctica JP610]
MTLTASKGVSHKWHYTNNADFASKGGKKRKSKVSKTTSQPIKRMQSAPIATSKSAKIFIPYVSSLKSFDCLPRSPAPQLSVPASPPTKYSSHFYGMQETPPLGNTYLPLNFEEVLDSSYARADANSLNMLSPLSAMKSDSSFGGFGSPVIGTPPMCELPGLSDLGLNDLISKTFPLLLTDNLLQDNSMYFKDLFLINPHPADLPALVDFNIDNVAFNSAVPSSALTI